MTDIEKTLAERGARYGDFTVHAQIAQQLQNVFRRDPETHFSREGWDRLDDVKRQALTVIADKISRILSGDPEYTDNWHDIAGYAKLAEDRCKVEVVNAPQPQPDADGWIPWGGGECPVDGNALVIALYRNGLTGKRPADLFQWHDNGFDYDIIAYKVVDHE